MILNRITFTGADDQTDREAMRRISVDCPQVEWGILLSPSQAGLDRGSYRFPSIRWIAGLLYVMEGVAANLSGHLCGKYVRDILNNGVFFHPRNLGRPGYPELDLYRFGRFQINTHAEPYPAHSIVMLGCVLEDHPNKTFVIQMDGVNEGLFHQQRRHGSRIQPLFDLSHGNGVLPEAWPEPIPASLCGYAGGLGPDNLADQLKRLADRVGDREIWVDMETKVRNQFDHFDLDMVKRCIEIASPYFKPIPA